MRKLLLILAFITSFSSAIFAQCVASFTWTQTASNVISFTNTSTGASSFTNYHWTFGDATSSYTQNPTHTYNIPGTYNVCLTLHDSLGCNDTYCDTITVTGINLCNITLMATTLPASCGTCPDGSAHASATNGVSPYSYTWQTTPPQTTATATGLAPGTYTCCVTDASGCTACNTATVGVTTCFANFTWAQTAANTIAFTNTSTGTTPYTHYHWTFGAGPSTGAQNPTHHYTIPGTYVVCLQISDSTTICYNTFCDTVTVTGVNCNNISLYVSGTDASCPTCLDGSATATPYNGNPPFTYLWSTSATTQTLNNLGPGMYTCCITDAIGCTACHNVTIGGNGGCNSYFTVSYVSPQTYTGTNLATGVPPLTYLWSWGDSYTSNTAYPTHVYSTPGFYLICLSITDSLGCTSMYCDSFNIVRMATPFSVLTINIVPPGPSGIGKAKPENFCSVYPNPASNFLVVDYSLAASANTRIILYDMLGNEVRSFRDDMSDGKHELVFDIHLLRQGVYLLSLQSNQYSVTRQIAVVK